MGEVAARLEIINGHLGQLSGPYYHIAIVESVGLQFRKVFELIAFASLAANRKEYEVIHADFATHWKAKLLVKNLRDVNPKFYPQPRGKDRISCHLKENDLIEAHDKCGRLLHAPNPFGRGVDYPYYLVKFPIWSKKCENLLAEHIIQLFGDDDGLWHILINKKMSPPVSYARYEKRN